MIFWLFPNLQLLPPQTQAAPGLVESQVPRALVSLSPLVQAQHRACRGQRAHSRWSRESVPTRRDRGSCHQAGGAGCQGPGAGQSHTLSAAGMTHWLRACVSDIWVKHKCVLVPLPPRGTQRRTNSQAAKGWSCQESGEWRLRGNGALTETARSCFSRTQSLREEGFRVPSELSGLGLRVKEGPFKSLEHAVTGKSPWWLSGRSSPDTGCFWLCWILLFSC